MKRLKDLLLSVFIFGSIVVIVLVVVSFFNTKRTIELSTNTTTEAKFNFLKQRVEDFDNSECKTILKDYIDNVDKGYFYGKVSLKKVYDYFGNFPVVKYYEDVKNKCNFTQEELDEADIASKYLSTMVLPETFLNKYYFSYEFHLKDELRMLVEPNTETMTYQLIRNNQIQILNDYVSIIESKEDINE